MSENGGPETASPSSLEDLAGFPTPKEQVERGHREPVEALAEDGPRGREEPVPCSDDIGGLVVVEPSPRLEERGHFTMATGPEEPVVRERPDRRIGGPRLRLNREDAEAHLLEQSFVRERSEPAEFGEAGLDRPALRGVLGAEDSQVAVPRRDAKSAEEA